MTTTLSPAMVRLLQTVVARRPLGGRETGRHYHAAMYALMRRRMLDTNLEITEAGLAALAAQGAA